MEEGMMGDASLIYFFLSIARQNIFYLWHLTTRERE
jgi:hypothetical protein